MRNRRRAALVIAAGVLLLARAAIADPAPVPGGGGGSGSGAGSPSLEHLETPATCRTDGGADLRLPAGYFLPEDKFSALDKEMRRLQDAETRLTAENKSMRQSLSTWQPGWMTLAGAVVGGAALGWFAKSKL